MLDLNEEENEWEHLNRTNWRGLGLTDSIKSVEVRPYVSLKVFNY